MRNPSLGTQYAVLSAKRYEPLDALTHQQLKRDLEDMWYAPLESEVSVDGIRAPCWVVPEAKMKDMVLLAKKYGLGEFSWCGPGGTPTILRVVKPA